FVVGAAVRFASFSPNGEQVLTCSAGSSAAAQLWRVADGSEVLHFNGHRDSLLGGSFHHTGTMAATSARDGTTCIWPTDPVAVASRLPLRSEPTDDAASPPPSGPTTTAQPK